MELVVRNAPVFVEAVARIFYDGHLKMRPLRARAY